MLEEMQIDLSKAYHFDPCSMMTSYTPFYKSTQRFAEPMSIHKLLLSIKGVASSENQSNILKSVLLSFFIIKQSKVEHSH